MGDSCGRRRAKRRWLVSAITVVLVSAFFSEPAFAQLPLGSLTNDESASSGTTPIAEQTGTAVQGLTQPIAQVVSPTTETATPVVQTVTEPVAEAAAPVVQQTAPLLEQTTAPIVATVEPLAQATTPILEAVEPVVDAAATPVLEATSPLLEATAPVLEATGPLLETTSPLLDSTAPKVGSSAPLAATGMTPTPDVTATSAVSESASAQPTSVPESDGLSAASGVPLSNDRAASPRDGRPAPARPHRPGPVAWTVLDGAWVMEPTVASPGGHAARPAQAAPSRVPAPTEPSTPLGLLVELAAAYGSNALLLFVVALAALFLAAPGLSRRLRLNMAPWPLPVRLPSDERPG